MDKVTVRPAALIDILTHFIRENINTMVVGRPGIGKSEIMEQVASLLGYKLLITHPALSDPTDYKGMPCIIDGKASFVAFDDLEVLINVDEPTIFFIDDLGQAPPSVQAALMQLVQARRVNGHIISDHVRFVAATNGREDRAGVSGILDPVKDRFSIFHLEPTWDDWHRWALRQDWMPDVLIAAVRYRPNWITGGDNDPKKRQSGRHDIVNRCTPRGLARCGRIMNTPLSKEHWFAAFTSCIGQAAASELKGYIKQMGELPRLDDVLANPETAKVPTNLASVYGITGALVTAADMKNLDAIMTYIGRFREEFQVYFGQDLFFKNATLTAHPSFARWANDHIDDFVGV